MAKVKAALVQTSWTGNKDSMVEKHLKYIDDAAKQGAQVMCLQELFYGPYFCQIFFFKDTATTEKIPDGPTTKAMQERAKKHGMVLIVPMYEEEQPGIYYNTAAVIDADGKYLGKYRKTHIPHLPGFWEKFYFRPGNSGYPVFDTAVVKVGVYICCDRHFPEGARMLGLHGAELVFIPRPRHVGCRCTSGSSSRPRTRSRTATGWARSTVSVWRASSERTTTTAPRTSQTRAARSSRKLRTRMRSCSSRTSTWIWSARSATPGSSTATADPTCTTTSRAPEMASVAGVLPDWLDPCAWTLVPRVGKGRYRVDRYTDPVLSALRSKGDPKTARLIAHIAGGAAQGDPRTPGERVKEFLDVLRAQPYFD